MRHKKKKNKINRTRAHTKSTFHSIASSVIKHQRITTTVAKAKKTKPLVDKLITLGKKGDVHSRRRAANILEDKKVLKSLFEEIAPRFEDREGGYTRVIRRGYRKGDSAPLAIIELVGAPAEEKTKEDQSKEKEEKPPEEESEEEKKGFVEGLRGLFSKKDE